MANSFALVILSRSSTDEASKDLSDLTLNRQSWHAESRELQGVPWYSNYRYLSIGLVLATALFVVPLL